MNLEQALNDYLRIRRSLGFRLQQQGNALRNFVAFLRAQGASYITTELALQWATQPAKVDPAQWAWRLGRVRRFAIWCSATEPRTEIPPQGFSLIVADASLLTSIATRRSRNYFVLPNNFQSNRPDTTLMTNYWFSWRASDYVDSKGHASSSQALFPVGSRHNRVVGMFLVHIHADIFNVASHKGRSFLQGLRQAPKPYSTRGALYTASRNRRSEVVLHIDGHGVSQGLSV